MVRSSESSPKRVHKPWKISTAMKCFQTCLLLISKDLKWWLSHVLAFLTLEGFQCTNSCVRVKYNFNTKCTKFPTFEFSSVSNIMVNFHHFNCAITFLTKRLCLASKKSIFIVLYPIFSLRKIIDLCFKKTKKILLILLKMNNFDRICVYYENTSLLSGVSFVSPDSRFAKKKTILVLDQRSFKSDS